MAIFHLSTKAISRKIGRTATVSAAYRSGEKIKCERTGLIHDYTRKKGVMTSSAFLFDGDKKIVLDRQDLWNTAEKSEKRKDARTAREIIVNLPHELSHNQRLALVDEFTKLVAKTYGVAIDYAIHEPNRKGDDRNFHAHIMMTTRQATLDNGVLVLGAKSNLELENKALKAKGLPSTQQQITDIRKDWADYANEHLKKAGLDIEIDHRSHKERGLAATPTIKLGVA
uniref:MobQ family relaxase n=1 Tax=Moraxella catarrhalis TaxID=480 RepID=UPI0013D4B8DC